MLLKCMFCGVERDDQESPSRMCMGYTAPSQGNELITACDGDACVRSFYARLKVGDRPVVFIGDPDWSIPPEARSRFEAIISEPPSSTNSVKLKQ